MLAQVKPGSLHGELIVPGSKSHTIRAVLLATLSQGRSVIHNPLTALDGLSAKTAAISFGARVIEEPGKWTIDGVGSTPATPDNYVDVGNSGTTRSFVASMAALCDGYVYITGDEQIRTRPVKQILDALCQLGAKAFPARIGSESCPAIIRGRIRGGTANLGGSNSQFVSSLLLSCPLIEGDTTIMVANPMEKPYVQMTMDWMKRYGVEISDYDADFRRFAVKGGQKYFPRETTIPSDWSAVAFPLVAAVVTDSELVISGVDFEDSQGDKAIVDYLSQMGADITKDTAGGHLVIKGGKTLRSGITIDMNDTPDALPALAVLAAFAEGDTTFVSLAHLREKETDRVAVMTTELRKLGADVEASGDKMVIHGGRPLTGAPVESYGDHRVAMSMAVAGLFAKGTTTISQAECAETSFPGFYRMLGEAGGNIVLDR